MKKRIVLIVSVLLLFLLILFGEPLVKKAFRTGEATASVSMASPASARPAASPAITSAPESPAPVSSGPQKEEPEASAEYSYIGNQNTRKFHLPSCSYLPQEQNRVYLDSYEEAVADGYRPCKKCRP